MAMLDPLTHCVQLGIEPTPLQQPELLQVGFFFFFFLCLFRATLVAYGRSQARGQIGATAAGLHHSHSNAGSKPRLEPTPQLTAMPDPQPAE